MKKRMQFSKEFRNTAWTEIKPPKAVQKWIDDNALAEGASRVLCDQDDMTVEQAAKLIMESSDYDVPDKVLVWEPFAGESREQIANRISDEADNWRHTAMTVASKTLSMCCKK